jgi:hypothetical protein
MIKLILASSIPLCCAGFILTKIPAEATVRQSYAEVISQNCDTGSLEACEILAGLTDGNCSSPGRIGGCVREARLD